MSTTPATTAGRPLVEISGLHKRYGDNHVLQGIDLEVRPGEVMCLIGPSGSGKSTLLRCVNRLEIPDAGTAVVDGELMGAKRPTLRPPPEGGGSSTTRDRHGLPTIQPLPEHDGDREHHGGSPPRGPRAEGPRSRASTPGTRSGRAARSQGPLPSAAFRRPTTARRDRSGARDAADEPTSALDPELVGEVLDVMRELAASGMTMIVVTHEMSFAREVGDQVVFMVDGRVVERGDAREMLRNPQNPRSKQFLDAVLS